MCKLVDTRKHLFIVVDSGAIIQHIARKVEGCGLSREGLDHGIFFNTLALFQKQS